MATRRNWLEMPRAKRDLATRAVYRFARRRRLAVSTVAHLLVERLSFTPIDAIRISRVWMRRAA